MFSSAPYSISMHTYAVMGVNTAFLQASLMSRAKIHSVAPAKFAARLDMNKGNFNFQILPVEGVDTIASARYVHIYNTKQCMLKHFQ